VPVRRTAAAPPLARPTRARLKVSSCLPRQRWCRVRLRRRVLGIDSDQCAVGL